MIPTFDKIHTRFRLNGLYFDREELYEVAYSFIKEGKEYERVAGDFLLDWLNDKSHIRVKTSGATGQPKWIWLQKQRMVNSAIASGDFFEISVGDSAFHCLPADFIAGKMMLVRAMVLGLETDLAEPSAHPLEGVEKTYHFAAMTPLQAQHSLEKLHRIKKLIVGGAPVSRELTKALQYVPTQVYETYGMTETITHIAVKPLNHLSSPAEQDKAVFTTLPNVTVRSDERGCLVIQAPQVSEEPIVTNDLVQLHSETSFEWLGRIDNIINSGGVKLIPEQVEARLQSAVSHRFFVAGMPDAALGQKLVLVVEGSGIDEVRLYRDLQALPGLHKYEIPKAIYAVPAFYETENGKIIREKTLAQIRL